MRYEERNLKIEEFGKGKEKKKDEEREIEKHYMKKHWSLEIYCLILFQ